MSGKTSEENLPQLLHSMVIIPRLDDAFSGILGLEASAVERSTAAAKR